MFQETTGEILNEMTRIWLREGNIKKETESLLRAARNNAIETNYVKAKIDKMQLINKMMWRKKWND